MSECDQAIYARLYVVYTVDAVQQDKIRSVVYRGPKLVVHF